MSAFIGVIVGWVALKGFGILGRIGVAFVSYQIISSVIDDYVNKFKGELNLLGEVTALAHIAQLDRALSILISAIIGIAVFKAAKVSFSAK